MTAHDVEAKPCRAMNPDRLRKLIDSPSISNATRNVPMTIVKRQTLVTSWNGEQCDVRAFEKLAAPAYVVLTKDLRACTIGEGKPATVVPSGLQMTDISVRAKDEQLPDRLTVPLMNKKESFVHAAEIEHCAAPGSIMLSEGIMTPQERRERLHFETDHLQAKRAIHRADMNDRRLHQLMHVRPFHEVFRVETDMVNCGFLCSNERHSTSDVIGTQHSVSNTVRVRGEAFKTDLLSNNTTGTCRREYQSKNCNANPRLPHHDRIFNEKILEWNEQRAQHLRNESTGGRPYDIVNGGQVAYFPPTIPEKQHQWQKHPSIAIHPYTR